jgi:UDP-glucuronate 4-epimerase
VYGKGDEILTVNGYWDISKTCLVTLLLEENTAVVGFDNLNDYYDVSLKQSRLDILKRYDNFTFIKGDLADDKAVEDVFARYEPKIVVHLAAQAGVRYSIENPRVYIDSNIIGFFNILEFCRRYTVGHLLYASSSSVYGNRKETPFAVGDDVNTPVSLYAATKMSNELMAFTYSHLYDIPATGLRFFTVYGPYGRPDMAYFKFADKIFKDEPIQVYNNGDLYRDFTYIDDITSAMRLMLCRPPEAADGARYKIYNIGGGQPEHLLHFIEALENALGKKAVKEFLPMQPGDVYKTFADTKDLEHDFGIVPKVRIEEGLRYFAEWYKSRC